MRFPFSQIFAAVLTLSVPAASAQITIRVYDYAGVPEPVAERARAEASRIFRRAGVTTEWAVCPVSAQTAAGDPKCHIQRGPTDIQLNLLTHIMSHQLMKKHAEFGAAFPVPNGFGYLAAIAWDSVQDFAARWGASEGLLLGHVVAHEIGHLLLGTGHHSRRGIMRTGWGYWEMHDAARGQLRFTAEQAEGLRFELQQRDKVQRATTK